MLKLILFEYAKSCLTRKRENPYVKYLWCSLIFLGICSLLAANYLYFIRLEKDIGLYTAYGTGAIFIAFIIRTLSYWYMWQKQNPALTAIEKVKDSFLKAAGDKINDEISVKNLLSYLPFIYKAASIGAVVWVSYYLLKKG